MIALTQMDSPPRHLVFGAFGYDAVTGRLAQRLSGVETHHALSLGADFPGA